MKLQAEKIDMPQQNVSSHQDPPLRSQNGNRYGQIREKLPPSTLKMTASGLVSG